MKNTEHLLIHVHIKLKICLIGHLIDGKKSHIIFHNIFTCTCMGTPTEEQLLNYLYNIEDPCYVIVTC